MLVYLKAIADVREMLDNAVSNRVEDGYAPWHWDHELRDMLLQLEAEFRLNKRMETMRRFPTGRVKPKKGKTKK